MLALVGWLKEKEFVFHMLHRIVTSFFLSCVLCLTVIVTAQAQNPTQIVVGPSVTVLPVIERNLPEYPVVAKAQHVQGPVVIRVIVGPNGDVAQAWVLKGDYRLREAALDAVRLWRYEPQGKTVSTLVEFRFVIK